MSGLEKILHKVCFLSYQTIITKKPQLKNFQESLVLNTKNDIKPQLGRQEKELLLQEIQV